MIENDRPWKPRLDIARDLDGAAVSAHLGEADVDRYLEFIAARARPNTLLAVAFDLKVFFTVIASHQRRSRPPTCSPSSPGNAPHATAASNPLEDRETGRSARTIKRRLSSVSGLFGYLLARGDAR